VKDTTKKDSFLTICKNQPIVFNGITRNTTGIYKDTLINSQGCNSFLYLHLTVKDTTNKHIYDTTCKNSPKLFNGVNRNVTGLYRDTLMNAKGCDSFIYYHLFVKDTTKQDIYQTICVNQPITFNGISRNVSGIYKDTLVNAQGCDSFVYLHLTVNDTSSFSYSHWICESNPYYYNNQYLNKSGIYRDTLSNSLGCDSFVYLNLTVYSPIIQDKDTQACESFVHKGITFTSNALLLDTLYNFRGCDSVYILTGLEIHKPYIKPVDTINGCLDVFYAGAYYYRDTTILHIEPKSVFPYCDSTYQDKFLKVNPLPSARLSVSPDTLVKKGTEITLEASGGIKYIWSHTSQTNAILKETIDEPTYYEVVVVDKNQCDTMIRIYVDVEIKIDIPEVFSPNNDGRNDVFKIAVEGDIKIFDFRIFNRWGQEIYHSIDPNPEWDGRYNGEFVPQGSYVYQFEYLYKLKRVVKRGSVSVIK
jgi:gliding motility-associated-like protein